MSAEEEEEVCPVCCEVLEPTDRAFYPCPCEFQICMFCWKRIRDTGNGLCPACRRPYTDDATFKSTEALMHAQARSSEEAKRARGRTAPAGVAGRGRSGPRTYTSKEQLRDVRVVQRNLVYVLGLPPSIAREAVLRRPEYFGQYGRIVKVVVNKPLPATDLRPAAASAYITYAREADAKAAILASDNVQLEGRIVRASYGTTKYCHLWLRDAVCTNPDCLYLHDFGDPADSFTRDEMLTCNSYGNNFTEMVHPSLPPGHAPLVVRKGYVLPAPPTLGSEGTPAHPGPAASAPAHADAPDGSDGARDSEGERGRAATRNGVDGREAHASRSLSQHEGSEREDGGRPIPRASAWARVAAPSHTSTATASASAATVPAAPAPAPVAPPATDSLVDFPTLGSSFGSRQDSKGLPPTFPVMARQSSAPATLANRIAKRGSSSQRDETAGATAAPAAASTRATAAPTVGASTASEAAKAASITAPVAAVPVAVTTRPEASAAVPAGAVSSSSAQLATKPVAPAEQEPAVPPPAASKRGRRRNRGAEPDSVAAAQPAQPPSLQRSASAVVESSEAASLHHPSVRIPPGIEPVASKAETAVDTSTPAPAEAEAASAIAGDVLLAPAVAAASPAVTPLPGIDILSPPAPGLGWMGLGGLQPASTPAFAEPAGLLPGFGAQRLPQPPPSVGPSLWSSGIASPSLTVPALLPPPMNPANDVASISTPALLASISALLEGKPAAPGANAVTGAMSAGTAPVNTGARTIDALSPPVAPVGPALFPGSDLTRMGIIGGAHAHVSPSMASSSLLLPLGVPEQPLSRGGASRIIPGIVAESQLPPTSLLPAGLAPTAAVPASLPDFRSPGAASPAPVPGFSSLSSLFPPSSASPGGGDMSEALRTVQARQQWLRNLFPNANITFEEPRLPSGMPSAPAPSAPSAPVSAGTAVQPAGALPPVTSGSTLPGSDAGARGTASAAADTHGAAPATSGAAAAASAHASLAAASVGTSAASAPTTAPGTTTSTAPGSKRGGGRRRR